MKLKKSIFFLIAGMLALPSCNDYLDKLPDNRVDPETPEQLRQILVDGYSVANYASYCELSSDNIVDNQAPDENGIRYPNLTPYDPIDDQIFAWEDADKATMQDSPTFIWTYCYKSIAVANHVLAKLDEFEAAPERFSDSEREMMRALRGEALMIRAYFHYVLTNIFAMQYGGPEKSAQLVGIPYTTKPETTVHVDYPRLSVAEDYDLIEKDMLEALPLIDDNIYEQPKYHFNKRAANAFAARFYMSKRDYAKADSYATAALGADPSQMMRTQFWQYSSLNVDAVVQQYYSSASPSNFMLIPTMSWFYNTIGAESRYSVNREASKATTGGYGPTWMPDKTRYYVHPCYINRLLVNGQSEYGTIFIKACYLFEYTDKIAGIGYSHTMRAEFTAEETLLTRAEARLWLAFNGQPAEDGTIYTVDDVVDDLRIWDDSRKQLPQHYDFDELTKDLIVEFYDRNASRPYPDYDPRPYILQDVNIDEVCPSEKFTLRQEMMPYLWCVLHFRRIETALDGYRWFDIKRYGIEITHKIGRDRVETLTKDDPRRALQLPIEAISSGMAPNDRFPSKVEPAERTLAPSTMFKVNK